jgi:hypothetical protein
MGFLDNAVYKSVPQGSSLAKPLLLAFGALLASGALTGALTHKQAPTPAPGTSPAVSLRFLPVTSHQRLPRRQRPKRFPLSS